jgi:DNA-binding winged helix-turn-helix (wHTH) protein
MTLPISIPFGPEPISLATAAPFRLGALEIRPSMRQVRADAQEVIAEPRVLQVLIALTEANGAVVSREELVRRCWEGRIIGDDAINRSIAKARGVAELTEPPAFAIKTIPRVGYRLIVKATDGGARMGRRPGRSAAVMTVSVGIILVFSAVVAARLVPARRLDARISPGA